MPGEESWLFLKVSEKDPLKSNKKALDGERGRTTLFISVPKKLVPLATRRNRLRRLIREAVRHDPFFSVAAGRYEFKVTSSPGEPGLNEVKAALKKIKPASNQERS